MESIDIFELFKKLWAKKKLFSIVWVIIFLLSLLWIIPQPRYFSCSVSLAPETTGDNAGGITSIASSFGINLGTQGNDAIYPMLYPELIQSPEFIIDLFPIQISTMDNSVKTDYATYLQKYQKKNWLTTPFSNATKAFVALFVKPEPTKTNNKNHKIDPFNLTKQEYNLMKNIGGKVSCSVDQKTEVITISVTDQDRLVCALMADSVRQHLQDFIIQYRTKKARIDVAHYQALADSAKKEYDKSVIKYSNFCDANQDVILQSEISQRDKLENDMQMKYNAYSAMQNQLEAMKVKLQEKTPAFTTLKNATVPQKPAGPKRLIFIFLMLVFSTLVVTCIVLKSEIRKLLIFYKK